MDVYVCLYSDLGQTGVPFELRVGLVDSVRSESPGLRSTQSSWVVEFLCALRSRVERAWLYIFRKLGAYPLAGCVSNQRHANHSTMCFFKHLCLLYNTKFDNF